RGAQRSACVPAPPRPLDLFGADRRRRPARDATHRARGVRGGLPGDRNELPARSAILALAAPTPALSTGALTLVDNRPAVPDPASSPIQLTILRQGALNVVDLAELGSLIPRSETHVDDAFLRDLTEEMAHLAGSARASGTGAAARALERVGGLVFSHLLT